MSPEPAAPVTSRFEDLLAHRKIEGDDENNAIVDALALALGDVFARFGLIAFGDAEAGIEGSRILRDPTVAPLWALPHAALYVGAKLPGRLVGESDADYTARARDAAVYPFGLRRGTHEAVRRRIRAHLTGTQQVFISDNFGDDYGIYVRTLPDETPDPALIERLLEGDFVSGGEPGAIRAELALTYIADESPAWAEATVTWAAVDPAVTWANVRREDVT